MAKSDRTELLARWGQAEDKYRALVLSILGGSGDKLDKLDKLTVVEITKARVKADKRMQEYFDAALS